MEKIAGINSERVYCSLDIETTGFDPLKEEVLEVGFAFFKLGEKGIEVTEEWTQVFKPGKELSPQILGLTGITSEELEHAPKFSEHRQFIQDKLGDAIMVGHNISFDTKFLEGFGIKFSGELVDTLDLVQWLLPTHHSYNLENLMHTFGISHKSAHRALADALATLKLLEKLLGVYCGLPAEVKKKVEAVVGKQEFTWADFLKVTWPPLSFNEFILEGKLEVSQKKGKASPSEVSFKKSHFYNFSIDTDFILDIASSLHQSKTKTLLVVPQAQTALNLLKLGMVDEAEFLPEVQFDKKKFNSFLKQKQLSADEARFALKILVWQSTNWQSQALLDLNLSFFGGQFKTVISGGQEPENKKAKVVVCDVASFLNLAEKKMYKSRQLVVCGLSEFETAVTSGISTKISWSYINYLLKSYYNPEFKSGQQKFKERVEDGLLSSDLFFGLVSALLKSPERDFEYFKITPGLEQDEKWNRIKAAAEHFCSKLSAVNELLKSEEIAKSIERLNNFFLSEKNRVKWLELAEGRCVFFSMPLDISELVKKTIAPYPAVILADALDKEVLPKFYLNRLGLGTFRVETAEQSQKNAAQGDLFLSLKKVFSKKQTINYHCLSEAVTPDKILDILLKDNAWPAAVLFPSPVQVKQFYEANYQELKKRGAVLAQAAYGGSNKIFRNFSINKNSLLLAADKFVLKGLNTSAGLKPVSKLEVKTLILCRLPFDQFTHPYQEALSQSVPQPFEGYSLPRALYNFHSLIELFYTPMLKDIYVIDAKLAKPYAKVFENYWKVIPKAQKVA